PTPPMKGPRRASWLHQLAETAGANFGLSHNAHCVERPRVVRIVENTFLHFRRKRLDLLGELELGVGLEHRDQHVLLPLRHGVPGTGPANVTPANPRGDRGERHGFTSSRRRWAISIREKYHALVGPTCFSISIVSASIRARRDSYSAQTHLHSATSACVISSPPRGCGGPRPST